MAATTDAAATATTTTEKKVVLVTGGTGLVGHGIREYLAQHPDAGQGAEWVYSGVEDGYDLRRAEDAERLFADVRPTHVIHLAARVGGLFANMRYKVEFYRENILIDDNVMEACRRHGVRKLVSFLSTCIFPDKTTYPIDETMVHAGPPHFSNEGYAYAKRMIDVLNRCYAEEYGCHFTSVVPTNIFGPHDNYDLEGGHVIPALIHKAFLAKRDGTDFVILGSGKPLRQFVYSVDLGALVVWALYNYDDASPLILSVDEKDEVSIGDVARMVARAFEIPDERVRFDTSAADGQYRKTASNKKLRSLLPDFKFTPMEEAIRASCQWFSAHFDEARK